MGKWLRENNIKIDEILTSAHKRAIISAKHVRIGYQDNNQIPFTLMIELHERGGVFLGS